MFGNEREPVFRVHMRGAKEDHQQHDSDFENDNHIVELGRFGCSAHKQKRQQKDDRRRRHVEEPARRRQPCARDRRRDLDVQILHDAGEVAGPADRHRRRAGGIFENEIPADDPGEYLSERDIGVCVRAARHRNERRKLRIAQRDEGAGDTRQNEGKSHRRAGGVRGRGAGEHENAGADDAADAKRHQRRPTHGALQAVPLRAGAVVRNEPVQRLAREITFCRGLRQRRALS